MMPDVGLQRRSIWITYLASSGAGLTPGVVVAGVSCTIGEGLLMWQGGRDCVAEYQHTSMYFSCGAST